MLEEDHDGEVAARPAKKDLLGALPKQYPDAFFADVPESTLAKEYKTREDVDKERADIPERFFVRYHERLKTGCLHFTETERWLEANWIYTRKRPHR